MSGAALALLAAALGITAPVAIRPDPLCRIAGDSVATASSVTRHAVDIGGERVEYEATAATMVMRGGAGEPIGCLFYTAYVRLGVPDPTTRPITFAYNGGPGSASVMVHIGAFGPRRIVFADTTRPGGPPYRMVDNAHSLLDRSDLVFIDPIGTGFSRIIGTGRGDDFWGVDQDAASVADFITTYLNRTNRWNSPRYLAGESYGATRTAVVADLMHRRQLTTFNGLILISAALNSATLRFLPGNDLPFVLFLPSFAATAWYHGALAEPRDALEPLLAEVERFATGDYAAALLAGSSLEPARRADVLERLHRYTGLTREYLDRANLRVEPAQFQQQLLRDRRRIVARQDARFTGPLGDPLAERPAFDVSSTDMFPAFLSLFNHYVRGELGFSTDLRYIFHEYGLPPWDQVRTSAPIQSSPPGNVMMDLADVLHRSPRTRVLLVSGVYDLATPYFASRWVMDHLGLAPELRANIQESVHEGGHAMYVREASLARLKREAAAFVDATAAVPPEATW